MAYAARLLRAMPAPTKGKDEEAGSEREERVPFSGASSAEVPGYGTRRISVVRDRLAGARLTRKEPRLWNGSGKRGGFVPRREEDYGGGGAFPEVHVMQYPLGMGLQAKTNDPTSRSIVQVVSKPDGSLGYDAIVKQGENRGRNVFTDKSALMTKRELMVPENLEPPSREELEEDIKATESALEKVVEAKLAATRPKHIYKASRDPTYVKYTPQGAAGVDGSTTRIIQMHELPVDPLEPPKFKYKKVPKGTGDVPVPVLHSPPKKLTRDDMESWKIPPCISNWKNSKGYTIPLDKRLAADGRSLQDVQINDQFAKFSEALYVAEQKARESVEMRAKIQRELAIKEKEKKEEQLRELAMQARMERVQSGSERYPGPPPKRETTDTGLVSTHGIEPAYPPPPPIPASSHQSEMDRMDRPVTRYDRGFHDVPVEESREERQARRRRDEIREERRQERERERRMEASGHGKRSKLSRDRERDISERVALGQANVPTKSGEAMYDQRLFNQEEGMGSGFAAEDVYNLYDKPLFADRSAATGLYRTAATEQELSEDEELEKVYRTSRFKPTKGFAGTEGKAEPRNQPVQFEKEVDPFGIDEFLTDVRQSRKESSRGPSMGIMAASAGGANTDAGWSGRARVDFQRGKDE